VGIAPELAGLIKTGPRRLANGYFVLSGLDLFPDADVPGVGIAEPEVVAIDGQPKLAPRRT
jgi:hypothetical protein